MIYEKYIIKEILKIIRSHNLNSDELILVKKLLEKIKIKID
tara:strand:+ start:555 stop:677 length:123 start_codon:yes stop_codon:yes gene_type:complete